MRIFLAQPSQHQEAQQTNIHFRSGIWSSINRAVSNLRLRHCGHRGWKLTVTLLNCIPELISSKILYVYNTLYWI